MRYFVTAIHTDSGKTLVSSILVNALQADYWKPVQCGYPRDLETVSSRVYNKHCLYHPERYLLKEPMSPHAAAAREGVTIRLEDFQVPDHESNPLVIEGAGGVLVPLNDKDFVIDLAAKFEAEVILVANNYLGSINHTLLTVNELRRRKLPVKGIIFNGPENRDTEDYILQYSGYRSLLRIRPETAVTDEMITRYSIKLFENWDA